MFIRIALLSLSIVCTGFASAQSPVQAGKDGEFDFLRRSQTVIRQAAEQGNQDADPIDQRNIEVADRIARQAGTMPISPTPEVPAATKLPSLGLHNPAGNVPPKENPYVRAKGVYIFASYSMTDSELKDVFEVSTATGATVLFRGIQSGMSINKHFARAHSIGLKLETYPKYELDPRPFEHFDVTAVPTVVVSDGADFSKVSGTLSVSYVNKRFDDRQFGDAGARGTTREIVERPLMEEIAERLSKIDFEEKKRAAAARYFTNLKFVDLPKADVSKSSYFDPTVVNEDEIVDDDGNVIAPPGVAFNPLDIVNFSKTIIIFDAEDKRQLKFAKEYANSEAMRNRGVILLTTTMNREKSWKGLSEYGEFLFPHRLFLLDELVASRFGVKAVPSVIKAEGRQFRIEQFAHSSLK